MPHTQHLLSIALNGPQQADLSRSVVSEIANRGCSILECRLYPVGDQFAANLLVSGNWSSLGRLETALPAIAGDLGLTAHCTRSAPRPMDDKLRPYAVEIIAPQEAGLLRDVLEFFRSHDASVVEIAAQHYDAAQTGAALTLATIRAKRIHRQTICTNAAREVAHGAPPMLSSARRAVPSGCRPAPGLMTPNGSSSRRR